MNPRRHSAINNASIASSLVICGLIDQPITRRKNRSSYTAKYNQPHRCGGDVRDTDLVGFGDIESEFQTIR